VEVEGPENRAVEAEIVSVAKDTVSGLAYGRATGLARGDRVRLVASRMPRPCDAWIGCVIDALGRTFDGTELQEGDLDAPLDGQPPAAAARRALGPRLGTGYRALDTCLPMCRGQRIGLFAPPGVGKSILLGGLAQSLEADLVVVGLIGERGREVNAFVKDVLGETGMRRSIIIAATSDMPPLVKRRAAYLTLAVAEYFRDQGRHVLCLMDSLTRFAEAHREIALTAGELPALRGFPPSTFSEISQLCERAGPGATGQGDITAVFTVLVAGGDADEPISEATRATLDGHVALSREIAERGRFPAIDLLLSVSRSLPAAAEASQNDLIGRARRFLSLYRDLEPMVRLGAYNRGVDQEADAAVALFPGLDAFLSERSPGIEDSFAELSRILASAASPAAPGKK
jgi:flagellum-specific ATP synthase